MRYPVVLNHCWLFTICFLHLDLRIDPHVVVQTWLSNNETKRDLTALYLGNMKAEFIIYLSFSYARSWAAQSPVTKNATSRYTHIYLPNPSSDEFKAMTFLSSEKNEQSDEAYSRHADNMEKYLSRTDFKRN